MPLILMKVGTSQEKFELGRCNMNTLNTELSLHLFILKFDKTIHLFSMCGRHGRSYLFLPILFMLVLVQYKFPLMCVDLKTKVK